MSWIFRASDIDIDISYRTQVYFIEDLYLKTKTSVMDMSAVTDISMLSRSFNGQRKELHVCMLFQVDSEVCISVSLLSVIYLSV